jgi:hypothetical protein
VKFWIRVNPQGHVTGSLVGSHAADSEEAHKVFTEKETDRISEHRQGWLHVLVSLDAWSRMAEPCLKNVCHHRKTQEGRHPALPGLCEVCGHPMDDHEGYLPCGERWDVCGAPDCAEPRLARWLRREQLSLLLSRVDRGVLLPEERKLLRAAVRAEIDDVERAHAMVSRIRMRARQ